jgi:hypothetical protein
VLAIEGEPRARRLLLAYTSSRPWRSGVQQLPPGLIEFDAVAAHAVGQRPFHLDLRCLARLPLTDAWFPGLMHPGHGVVGTASARLRETIDATMLALAMRSRDLIEMRGPR